MNWLEFKTACLSLLVSFSQLSIQNLPSAFASLPLALRIALLSLLFSLWLVSFNEWLIISPLCHRLAAKVGVSTSRRWKPPIWNPNVIIARSWGGVPPFWGGNPPGVSTGGFPPDNIDGPYGTYMYLVHMESYKDEFKAIGHPNWTIFISHIGKGKYLEC